MILLKYFIYTLLIYIILLIGTFKTYFEYAKNDVLTQDKQIKSLIISEFETSVKKDILNNEYQNVLKSLNKLRETQKFNNIEIKYTNLYITIESILNHSNNVRTRNWILNDIAIDAKYGELVRINDEMFLFIRNELNTYNNTLEVKFQALNDTGMRNSTSRIKYSLPKYNKLEQDKITNPLENKIKEILNLKEEIYGTTFYTDNKKSFATINYELNYNQVYKKLATLISNAFIYFNIIFFTLLILTILFGIYMFRSLFLIHLKELEVYVNDILANKFYKFNPDKLKYKSMANIATNLASISKKMASIINELNVNRGTLEMQISTDPLTKLPNYKIFEQDMKALFLTDIHSYIITLRLEYLKEYSSNNTQDKTDKFILMFSTILKSTIKSFENKNINLYRFYGSEFIIIVKHIEYKQTNKLMKKITKELSILNNSLKINDKIVHSVAVPFDHYSTTDKHLEVLDKLYIKTVNNTKDNSYYTLDNKKVDEEDARLEKVVTSIIQNNAFSLSYIFDTFEFNDPSKLIMQEVSANLINTDGSNIPIGTFISVAEHKNIAVDFDKKLIIKTFQYIKQHDIKHILAINISISSFNDTNFITWLESKLIYDYKNIIDKIIFSVTTFAVKNNFDTFVKFTNEIKKFDGKILLKRFSYNDLTLEQLEKLNLDYIRVHKDYTKNINKERKVILKNIINFCDIHDIKILGDTVSNKEDYDILNSLRFHATSK